MPTDQSSKMLDEHVTGARGGSVDSESCIGDALHLRRLMRRSCSDGRRNAMRESLATAIAPSVPLVGVQPTGAGGVRHLDRRHGGAALGGEAAVPQFMLARA